MRLDKYFSDVGLLSRRECKLAVKAGRIRVNDTCPKTSDVAVDETDEVTLDGETVRYRRYVYYFLNKPQGYVSATEDGNEPTVLELLPPIAKKLGVFPAGRLDKNTTGLMLLTNDGETAHRLLSPKHHVPKTYAYEVKFPLTPMEIVTLENGVPIDGETTKPCTVRATGEKCGEITLVEGRYHQIKRMMEYAHNQITSLRRISFGPFTLDVLSLAEGESRELTEEEIAKLLNYPNDEQSRKENQ